MISKIAKFDREIWSENLVPRSLQILYTFVLRARVSMIKQLLNLVYGFLHWKCIIKQLLDSVFVICKIINVSVRVIILAFGSANNFYLDIDDFRITINLIQPYVSHAMRPGLKDAVKFILRIGSAHNKGGESFRYKHGLNFASFNVFVDWNSAVYSVIIIGNQNIVRCSVSMSYFTSVEVGSVNKVFVCITVFTVSLKSAIFGRQNHWFKFCFHKMPNSIIFP